VTTVLLTGFEPFGGETVNPSWQAVSALAGRPPVPGVALRTAVLPCVYGAAADAVREAVGRWDPDVVIGVGQAGGRYQVTPERIAVNLDDAPAPDNAGGSPVDQPVVAGGPLAYRTGLPVKAIVAALRAAGIPAAVSDTAGTYICNQVFYALMHLAATERPGLRTGFVHVPYAHGQVVDKPGPTPSMALESITEALGVVVATTLATRVDLAVPAGSVS